MSSTKADLIRQLAALVPRWQDETQKYDEVVGEIYDLNTAERHCLSFLWPDAQTASAIAREVRLTPAAVTALIDRLERKGLVRREADPNDRRKVMVRATDKTAALTADVYAPLGEAGAEMLARYTLAELEAIVRFAREAIALQQRFTAALVAGQAKDGSGRKR
jgi:DNA-binding MarR family transcriptional regulator